MVVRTGLAGVFRDRSAAEEAENALGDAAIAEDVAALGVRGARGAFQERGRRGKLYAARAGGFFTGVGPYGHTYVASDGRGGSCVVNEAEAVIVRQIFAWLIEDQLSVAAIARRLTQARVPTRHGGSAWSPATVHKFVTNRLYTGEHYYNRSENAPDEAAERDRRPTKEPRRRLRAASEWIRIPWPAIIEEETFALAERQLQLNRERSPRNMRYAYLLSDLLVCGKCGRRLGGHGGAAHGRYECTRRRRDEPPERRCALRSVAQQDSEPLVWEQIRALLGQPELILAHLRAQAEDGPALTEGQREVRRGERQRAALAREDQRLLDAYQAGVRELDALKTRRQRLRLAKQRLAERAEIARQQVVEAQPNATIAETVSAFCARIQAQLVEPSFEVNPLSPDCHQTSREKAEKERKTDVLADP